MLNREVSKNLFSHIETARYNVAAWQDAGGTLFMLGREVERGPKNARNPDFGRLVLVEFDAMGNIIRDQVVWKPTGDSLWLEDPRALALPDGSVLIGLTAVLREKRGYKPYPAITRLSRTVWREETLPAITIVERFGPGKNITPIDDHLFLYRPEGEGYSHKLLLFSFDELLARKLQDIEFPRDLPWAMWRIGTALPPLWIEENAALIIFHGITITNGRYVYSLGKGRIDRKDGQLKLTVSSEPILTPDDFVDDHGRSLVSELHPKIRRVVYACGGVVKSDKQDTLSLFVNVGDTATFEVNFALADLMNELW